MKTKKCLSFGKQTSRSIRITAALLALFVLFGQTSAFASILGDPTSARTTEYSQGTILHTNTFLSAEVGQQTEHYVSYTPNPDITPIISNGTSVFGKRTLSQTNQTLNHQGIASAIGMNGDFFSLQTGVPMSNLIIDKRVVSKDAGWLAAVGFREDGTAFMGTLPISTNINTNLGSIPVECINKYRQPYALYLFTQDFGDSTEATTPGINIVLGDVSGDITLNSSVTAVVESVDEYHGAVAIPKGKWILSVDLAADQSILDRIATLTPGTKITLDTKDAGNDPRWESAVYAMGNTGGKLITDGKLDYTDEAAAPRSAIGIKADGTIIFYTLDGRQSGYSYGARKETVAKRLLELGCVEAMNLDGGGSTILGGVRPGTKDFRIINSPSDGGQRKSANFFFLKKNNVPTGIPYILKVSHWGKPVLSGSSLQLYIEETYDTSYGPASMPDSITYTLTDDADTASPDGLKTEVTADGYVTVRGNGDIYISAQSSGASGSTMLRAVATPEEVKVFDTATGEALSDLVIGRGETVSLSATAYWGGQEMIVKNGSFTWRVVSEDASIGDITKDGTFTASQNSGALGILAVNAGLCTAEIPVRIRLDEELPASVPRPEIQGEITEDGFTATISCEGSTVPKENIQLYVDGLPASFQYDNGTIAYQISKEDAMFYHRFILVVTAQNGAASMAGYNWGSPALCDNPFPDTQSHWAKDIISYMTEQKVVTGSSDDGSLDNVVFHPDAPMTRTEFAIMLCNYLNLNPADYQDVALPFTDVYEIPWWALERVRAVYALGLMQGQLNDYGVAFKPNDNIKRMEYAIAIQRLLPPGLAGAPITATDANEIPFWAKESMKIATAQGILSGYPDGSLKPSRSVTRAEAVKILHTVFGVGKSGM